MAVKAIVVVTDELYLALKPFYDKQVQQGNIEIVGQAIFENNEMKIVSNNLGGGLTLT